MSEATWNENFNEALEEPWVWLSFGDATLPEGSQSLGIAIVQGWTLYDAAANAWANDCNPGGEVMMFPLPPQFVPAAEYRNRLLTDPEEQAAAGAMDKSEARVFMEDYFL